MGKITDRGLLHTSLNYAALIEAQAKEPSFLSSTVTDGEYEKQKVKVMTKRSNSESRKRGVKRIIH